MKRKNIELFLEGWVATLKYLDHHRIHGTLLFGGISFYIILTALKFVTPELIQIIEALK